jgi:hypothetical protein
MNSASDTRAKVRSTLGFALLIVVFFMAHKDPVIRKAYFKNYNIDRKEETAVFNKAYRANHPELKQANAAWQKANSGQRAISQKKYRKENATEINQRARIKQKLLRLEVIAAMGGCCKCCGEKEPEFLVIDHVHGGGTKERKQGVGKKLYYHVKKTRVSARIPVALP